MMDIETQTGTCENCGRTIEREAGTRGLWKIAGDTACEAGYYHRARKAG